MSELVAGADHEINNLLMMIEGSAHILLSKDPSPEAKAMALEAISSKTESIKQVMEDLRSVLSSGENDTLKDNYVKDLVTRAIQLCRTRFKNHRIFFSININEYSAIECKETQVIQALLSILTICHDAILKNKEKWIKVSVCDLEAELIIDIQDSGNALSETECSNLCQENSNRSGVALNWAKDIVQNHKGKILFFNNDNHPVTRLAFPRLQNKDGECDKISQTCEIYEENVTYGPLKKSA